ncbi:hypothetical protein AB0283_31320 [Micromonospora vinacea]|uniref:hypothetical protein n=1 Tax=Micromonospora vinacea TaxID=709878 RepID=UPI00344D12AA
MSASKVNATLAPVRGPWSTTGALVPVGVAPGTEATAGGDGTPVDGTAGSTPADGALEEAPTDGATDGVDGLDEADEPTKTG